MLGIFSWRRLHGKDDHRVSITAASIRGEVRNRVWDYLQLAAISTVMIWAGLSLFFGGVYRRSVLANNINVYVVDLDGGAVGTNVTRMVLDTAVTPSTPVWLQNHDLNSVDAVKAWVQHSGWGALVVNPGASARLESALAGADHYNASAAMTLIESTGRQVVAEMLYVSSALTTTAQAVARQYAQIQVTNFQATDDPAQQQPNYAALINPVGFVTVDVAPAGFTMSPVMSTFGYLAILLSIIGVLIMWKMTSFPFFARVRFCDLALMWPVLLLGLALVLSLYQALAFLAFRGPNFNSQALTYTTATFFKFWFTGTAVAFSLGLWLFNWFLHLTPQLMALPSICTVIPNVLSTVSTFELAPKFYRIMYAMPFYNGSSLILYILTGAHPTIGRNVGVLVAEIVAMTALLTLSIWIRQICVLRGISDAHGWFHGSRYYHSHIPYYKDVRADAEHQAESLPPRRAGVEIVDYDDDGVSLTTGNLGV
ncbi:hypothetical protein GGH98_002156 [Coemansia sp. RSA 454]|nr:hypothetical protein LPJ67_002659 [Coemansia sp. RSA 1938]KAJ2254985.1 hypothetical protein GGH98_002156 [Coemansia sp. RSA 454]KAJ2438558.1 hypothetical protein IWW46_004834 [Coemansia sp. RSA 2440]